MTTSTTAGAVIIALHATGFILVFPHSDAGLFVVTNGEHGWFHGDAADAFENGQWLAENTGKPMRVIKDKKNVRR